MSGALRRGDVSASSLREYDRGWKERMGREIKLGYWARRLAGRLSDREIERVVRAVQGDGFFAFAKRRARFDWHREAISYLFQMPGVLDVISDGHSAEFLKARTEIIPSCSRQV